MEQVADPATGKVREVLTLDERSSEPQGPRITADSLSHEDEELLRTIGTGAHAAGRHSDASGRTVRYPVRVRPVWQEAQL